MRGHQWIRVIAVCALTGLMATGAQAQVPGILNYQGRVVRDGTNVNGVVEFKFAIVSSNASHRAVAVATVFNGFLVDIAVLDGGSGYGAPPNVVITDITGQGAAATATVAGGQVSEIAVTAAGYGYSYSPAVTVDEPPPATIYTTRWSNDGTPSGEPAEAVAIAAVRGLFSVALGDTALPGMQTIPAQVFDHGELWLRTWFRTDGGSFEELLPRCRLSAVGTAMRAAGVVPGGVTSVMLAEQSVTGSKIQPGSIGAAAVNAGQVQLRIAEGAPPGYALRAVNQDGSVVVAQLFAGDITGVSAGTGLVGGGSSGDVTLAVGAGAVTGSHLADGAVTTAKIAANAVTLAKLNTTELDARYVNRSGDTISGALSVGGNLTVDTSTLVVDAALNRVGITKAAPSETLDVGGGRIGGVGAPNSDDDAVSKGYLDSRLSGDTVITISSLKLTTSASGVTVKPYTNGYVAAEPSTTGPKYLAVPVDLPAQINGVPLKFSTLKVSYRVGNAASYIASVNVKQANDTGGSSYLYWDSTSRTSTSWTTFTFGTPTPPPWYAVTGGVLIEFQMYFGGTGFAHEIYLGNIVMTLKP